MAQSTRFSLSAFLSFYLQSAPPSHAHSSMHFVFGSRFGETNRTERALRSHVAFVIRRNAKYLSEPQTPIQPQNQRTLLQHLQFESNLTICSLASRRMKSETFQFRNGLVSLGDAVNENIADSETAFAWKAVLGAAVNSSPESLQLIFKCLFIARSNKYTFGALRVFGGETNKLLETPR